MPRDAPVSKVLAVEALGARVRIGGETVDEALEQAQAAQRRHRRSVRASLRRRST